jgi:hypothetical protein
MLRSSQDAPLSNRNWHTEPGMYNARLSKSFCRSGSTPTTKQTKKKSKKDKKKLTHYKNYVSGHRQDGVPTYWIKELNKLNNKEFEKALTYWMDHFKFIGHPTTLPAYDEGRYLNPNNKPSGCRRKNNYRRVDRAFQRNQPIVVACQTYLRSIFNINDVNCVHEQLRTKIPTRASRTCQPSLHHQNGQEKHPMTRNKTPMKTHMMNLR